MKSIYRKFTDQIAADAALSASAFTHPSAFAWLLGDWTWCGRPVRFANSDYGVSLDAEPFLIYNAAANMWVLVLADPEAYGILIGLGMRNGEARFTGDVTIEGQSLRFRQTWRRRQDHIVEIENERMVEAQKNRWQLWDRALLERVTPPN
ncbi:MAG: hypothetical protein ACKV2U_05420 [Bryobacteraceae bacterium]